MRIGWQEVKSPLERNQEIVSEKQLRNSIVLIKETIVLLLLDGAENE
jgi:hypothetical protein